jgi:tetratricopeptide (TPR) repeat protein
MRHDLLKASVALLMGLPLGACSSFLGIHFARHTPKAEPVEALATSVGASTEAGRARLADGQPGLAIESFQRAVASGEPAAPALNGLGVAYSRLGRDDLAERFFREAMVADPTNTRYADNLTLLMRSPSFAARNAAALAAQASQESTQLLAQTNGDAQTAEPLKPAIGQLQRLSRAEVHITTAPSQAAPLRPATAKVDSRTRPLIRVGLASEEPKGFKPLVRFELPQSKPVDTKVDGHR